MPVITFITLLTIVLPTLPYPLFGVLAAAASNFSRVSIPSLCLGGSPVALAGELLVVAEHCAIIA